MFHRPLIQVLFAFTGGILVAHKALPSTQVLVPLVFLSITFALLTALFLYSRLRILCLILIFFLTGILLEQNSQRPSQLLPFATQRKKATIEGTVLEPARVIKDMTRLKIKTHRLFIEGKTIYINEDLIISVYGHVSHFGPGEMIRFPARLRPISNFNNPGQYDYRSAMKLKGISCAASVSDGRFIVPMGPGHIAFPHGLLEKIQRPVRDFFNERLNPEDEALFRALILGERQGIDNELREPFNQVGLGHVLAVSGLHVGLVAWLAFFIFRWVLLRSYKLALKTDIRKPTAFLTCLPVIGYTFLAGFQVSSQRAMIMVLVFLWSLILGRGKEVWSTLALAGLLILAIDPPALFSISFQLSFSAVIGILWLAPAILSRIPAPNKTQPGERTLIDRVIVYVLGLIAVSLSATIFLLPIICLYFHRIPLVAIPANITVVPILGLWVIPLGLLSTVTLPFSPQVAGILLHLGSWGLHGMMEMIRFWARLPWSSLWTITPNYFEMFMFYMLISLIFFVKRRPWAKTALLILGLSISADIGYWVYRVRFNSDLKVTFLDVGQGNAAVVEFPKGEKMLIDGGGSLGDHFDVGRMVVAPYLWHSKIRHIDYLVLSHPQADHMNGLRFIAKAFNPKEFWHNGDEVETRSFKELIAITESKKINRLLPGDLRNGRWINGVEVQILHPGPDVHRLNLSDDGIGLNNNSLVLKISYGGKSFLFPGDLEQEGEETLISNTGKILKTDILLSPHHGSKSSSSKEFLELVQPHICVISSGGGNHFGFPHQQTLKRLRDIGCRIIRIDKAGAVQCVVGPHKFEITTFKKYNSLVF